jgi:hypothetical protein
MAPCGVRQLWILAVAGSVGFALVAAVLFCFDPSNYRFYPICLFYKTTGLLCPGCGCLRAMHQLLHGHVSAAFHFNPLLVLSLPFLLWFATVYAIRTIRNEPVRKTLSGKWVWLIMGIGLAVSIWRNLPGSPFAMLPP